MLVSDLCQGKYLITAKDFEEVQFQWRVSSDVPLKLSVSVAGGLIIATRERQMWYEDMDKKNGVSLWMVRFYVPGDEKSFFWFSKRGDKIGDLEIQHLNENLIKRIGEVKWQTLRN
jgi:hypothetical protein